MKQQVRRPAITDEMRALNKTARLVENQETIEGAIRVIEDMWMLNSSPGQILTERTHLILDIGVPSYADQWKEYLQPWLEYWSALKRRHQCQ